MKPHNTSTTLYWGKTWETVSTLGKGSMLTNKSTQNPNNLYVKK